MDKPMIKRPAGIISRKSMMRKSVAAHCGKFVNEPGRLPYRMASEEVRNVLFILWHGCNVWLKLL
jgi:hypothetical protein